MRPFLSDGTFLRVEPLDKYHPGDVVLYGPPESSAVHRLYFYGNEGWWIGDDAATLAFHRVNPENIRGRVVNPVLPQGFFGLACGAGSRLFFSVGRRVKRILIHHRKPA